MQNDNDGIQRFDTSHWWNVFCRLFVSKGIFLFLFVAPFFWALLPFAYRHIKKTDALIEANPLFLVCERMGVSCLLSIVFLLLIGLVLIVLRPIPSVKSFGNDCLCAIRNIRRIWKSRIGWLVLLAVFYAGARILEMALILGYPQKSLNDAQLSALQDYGYFMGLMLALPIGFVATLFWKLLHQKSNWAERIDYYGLRGKSTTLSSAAFWICVAFLTLSSGMLYICAEEPCGVWGEIGMMTLWACVVAILTNLGAGCKSMGKLIDEEHGNPSFAAILLSSVGINVVMSLLTALFAFCGAIVHLWMQQKTISVDAFSTIGSLFGLYWEGDGFGWALWIVVGLLASVVAPISQLIGVSLHDKEKSSLARFGVRGGDWLVIGGGFEPLLVAVLTFVAVNYLGGVDAFKLCWNHEGCMNSNLLMFMAVSTVIVIAIVKIVEVWVDKNSVIRNAIFRQVRGSSVDVHNNDPKEMLYRRAVTLSLLKLYDKREELATEKVALTGCLDMNALELHPDLEWLGLPYGGMHVYLTRMENAEDYFTTDDPFTADVLRAHEKWCESASRGNGKCMSLKRFIKKYAKPLSNNSWAGVKKQALTFAHATGAGNDVKAMPFVIIAADKVGAEEYIACWNQLLGAISDSLTSRKIVGQINKMICDFDPGRLSSKSGAEVAEAKLNANKAKHRTWRFFAALNKFVSLLFAREILLLLLVFFATWVANWLAHCSGGAGLMSAMGVSFRSLFAINAGSLSGWRQVFAIGCFFVVWLIGGGVLVSVLVAQRRRHDNGDFRLWKLMLGNHVVFLGWDENVPALMRKVLGEDKNGEATAFIVVTMHNVDDVVKAVLAANIDRWRLYVYRGFYDDDREIQRLDIAKAKEVYIMGECGEEAHDSRVYFLAERVKPVVTNPTVGIYVNIADFGLAYRLDRGIRASSLHGIKCINFHLNSASAMVSHISAKGPFTNMAIIGFGAMGKAVLIQALKENVVNVSTPVLVTDDDVNKCTMELSRFKEQFSEYKSNVKDCPYNDVRAALRKVAKPEKWLVVVAKHRSEKGLGIVWDILSDIKTNPDIELVLNQEVRCDFWDIMPTTNVNQNTIEIEGRKIELFGFKRGDVYMFR